MTDITLDNYPALRDQTRAMTKDIEARLNSHLDVVAHRLQPDSVYGATLVPLSKRNPPTAPKAYAELVEKYNAISTSLRLDTKLPDPVEVSSTRAIVRPFPYRYSLSGSGGARDINVQSAFRFVLAYPEFPFPELCNIIRSRELKSLKAFILNYVVLNSLIMRDERLMRLFGDLRFPLKTELLDGFGGLPITMISAPLRSVLPPDALISQLCRFSGADTAEELVDFRSTERTEDPIQEWIQSESAKVAVAMD